MGEQGVDDGATAVDEVEHAGRQAGLLQQAGDFDGGEGNLFARL